MFCLELDQLFTISENHVTLSHSACDMCVSAAVRSGQGCNAQVRGTDASMGSIHYLGVSSLSFLPYDTIKTRYGIFKDYGAGEFHSL